MNSSNIDVEVFLRGTMHSEDNTLVADIKNYASEDMTIFVTTSSKYEYIKTHRERWNLDSVINWRKVMSIERFTGFPDLESTIIPYEEPAIISFYDYFDFTPEQLKKSYFLIKNHPDSIAVKVLEDDFKPFKDVQLKTALNYKKKNNGVAETFIDSLSSSAAGPYCNLASEPTAKQIK